MAKPDRPSLGLPIEDYIQSLRAYVVRRESARAEDDEIHREMADALREDSERRRSLFVGPITKPKASPE